MTDHPDMLVGGMTPMCADGVTREGWIARYAARIKSECDDQSEDMDKFARVSAREALDGGSATLDDNPEDAADEEMSCWDGE